MAEVLCMGELLVEFVSTEDNVSLVDTPGFIKAPGGAPANVAVAVQKLGMDAAFVGKVGSDPFGEFLRRSLQEENVDVTCLLTDPQSRTTAVFVAVWDDGRKDLCFYRNPGADMMLTAEEITEEMFDRARCFHYGSITFIDEPAAGAQRRALSVARERGLMVSYDPNYRPTLWPDEATARRVIQDSFRHCHLAKVSEEEWEVATGCEGFEEGIDAVLRKGVELLVVSLGPRGAVATNGEYRIEVPGWEVDVVETTGAGDGFLAALITGLLPERERAGSLARLDQELVEQVVRRANAVGALTCTRPGAIPALPQRAAVEEFMHTARQADGVA